MLIYVYSFIICLLILLYWWRTNIQNISVVDIISIHFGFGSFEMRSCSGFGVSGFLATSALVRVTENHAVWSGGWNHPLITSPARQKATTKAAQQQSQETHIKYETYVKVAMALQKHLQSTSLLIINHHWQKLGKRKWKSTTHVNHLHIHICVQKYICLYLKINILYIYMYTDVNTSY